MRTDHRLHLAAEEALRRAVPAITAAAIQALGGNPMSPKELVMSNLAIKKELDAMVKAGDVEASHSRADDLLLRALENRGAHAVVKAYREARDRCKFYYA